MRAADLAKSILSSRRLPVLLAIGAVLLMLPALKSGLFLDDLPQRATELRPDQLPAHFQDTGNPADSGSFSTVLHSLFFNRTHEEYAAMKRYGVLSWWMPDDMKLGLWRPVTAFTHWLDYRLFPDSPILMHAENIIIFAGIIWFAAILYRELIPVGWAAGLAGLLFLLDGNTYFPVMFIANRGFMLSLLFGLACLWAHHRWRTANSRTGLALSAGFLALSLFANEGGASTFAFILAYALMLESGTLRQRAVTILPAVLVIVVWRVIYCVEGGGLLHGSGYIDPANEPLEFGQELIPRALVLLAGQLTGLAPDLVHALNPSLLPFATAVCAVVVITMLLILIPCVCRDRAAAFWFAVMILAAVPAATVVPISKNLGFVAVGAYGCIASFVAAVIQQPARLPASRTYRVPAWCAAVALLLAHGPGAVAARVIGLRWIDVGLQGADYFSRVCTPEDDEKVNVIVINEPCALVLAYAPFDRAYTHEPLPKSLRTLVPGCTGFEVRRIDDATLEIQSLGPNMFACDDVGPVHLAYVFRMANMFIGKPQCRKGDRFDFGELKIEVLESDASGLASRVAFRFRAPLESPEYRWVCWNWQAGSYEPFKLPAVGQGVTLLGPVGLKQTPSR